MKKLLSIILTIGILQSICMHVLVSAAATYDVKAALEYAANHVNDGVGECAEFVSKCVKAGGLNVPIKTGTKGCWDAIIDASGLSGIDLALDAKGYLTKSNSENLLDSGDVVIQWCYTCNLRPHILICGGYDSEGYATFYAHNNPLNNKRYPFSTHSNHKATCEIGAKVIQLSKLNGETTTKSPASNETDVNAITPDSTLQQKCGDNVYWNLSDDGVLTISGTGDMYNYRYGMFYDKETSAQELENLQKSINSIIISEGVTSIGKYAFLHLSNVETVTIPKSIIHIEEFAFFYVRNLKNVIYKGNKTDWKKITIDDVDTCKTSLELEKVLSYEISEEANQVKPPYATISNKDYEIKVIKDGETLATALMSADGYIKEIQGSEYAHSYFRPLITNVNGVTCVDIPTGNVVFEYKDGALNSISGNGQTAYKKVKNSNCSYIDINDMNDYEIECNDDGLISHTLLDGLRMWKYDNDGRLIQYGYASSPVPVEYYYDENGLLAYCQISPGPVPVKYDYVYVTDGKNAESKDSAEQSIRVLVDNKFLECDQPPVIVNDRTLVPMRAIFEALGAEVSWDANSRTATGVKDGKTVSVTIDVSEIVINGNVKAIDTAAQIIGDRTMVPARAVAEAFDCSVNWNGKKRFVIIIPKNQQPYKVEVTEIAENKNRNSIYAVAQFNDRGLITKVDGNGDFTSWFAPFLANINGNTYVNHIWGYIEGAAQLGMFGKLDSLNFSYNDAGVLLNFNDYTYAYEDGLCTSATELKSSGQTDNWKFNYDKQIKSCDIKNVYPTTPTDTFTINEMGLIKEHHFLLAGYIDTKRLFEYNDRGMVTNCNGINFEYDEDDKLISASNGQKTVVYKYIYE